jgi:hypothetical protein
MEKVDKPQVKPICENQNLNMSNPFRRKKAKNIILTKHMPKSLKCFIQNLSSNGDYDHQKNKQLKHAIHHNQFQQMPRSQKHHAKGTTILVQLQSRKI